MNLGVFLIIGALASVAIGTVIIVVVTLLLLGELIWRAVH